MNKSWGRTAAMLSIALVLTACSDKDEPSTTPTPTPTASSSTSSPSASPSVSASASASPSTNASIPAAARARTEAGALAFLSFYYDQINMGFIDPKNAPDLFAYADKDCIACKKSQDHIKEYADGGWSLMQAPLRISGAALATDVTAPSVIINFTSEEPAQVIYRDGKDSGHKTPASTQKKGGALKWVNDGWQVYGFENL